MRDDQQVNGLPSYRELARLGRDLLSDTSPSDPALRTEAESFAFHEARLLDSRQYDAWLSLFTADANYWVPFNPEFGDPAAEISHTLDDHQRLEDRVARLQTGWAHAQIPPSRTCRTVSNVEAWPIDNGRRLRCHTVIWEHRGRGLTPYVSTNYFLLRRGADGWLITLKLVHLINSDDTFGSLAFIL